MDKTSRNKQKHVDNRQKKKNALTFRSTSYKETDKEGKYK
jgi:hypothetical protein